MDHRLCVHEVYANSEGSSISAQCEYRTPANFTHIPKVLDAGKVLEQIENTKHKIQKTKHKHTCYKYCYETAVSDFHNVCFLYKKQKNFILEKHVIRTKY